MSRQTWMWALVVVAVGSQFGLQPAWAGRRRRCCEPSPSPAQAQSARSDSQIPDKPSAAATGKPAGLDVPFQLTAAQQDHVDEVLVAWERKSRRNKSFSASFTLWDYSGTDFLLNDLRGQAAEMLDGKIACAAGDQWIIKTTAIHKINPETGKYETDPLWRPDAWMHDRTSFAFFDGASKQATEFVVTSDSISPDNGSFWAFAHPLVYLAKHFPWQMLHGTQARALKERYFLRVVTPEAFQKDEIWIDAFPRPEANANWCRRIVVKLQKDTYEPLAMRIYDPTSYRTYEFRDRTNNIPFALLRESWMQRPPHYKWEKVEVGKATR